MAKTTGRMVTYADELQVVRLLSPWFQMACGYPCGPFSDWTEKEQAAGVAVLDIAKSMFPPSYIEEQMRKEDFRKAFAKAQVEYHTEQMQDVLLCVQAIVGTQLKYDKQNKLNKTLSKEGKARLRKLLVYLGLTKDDLVCLSASRARAKLGR